MADQTVSERISPEQGPLRPEELRNIDGYWRASHYLCVGMIYFQGNPLLRESLQMDLVKKRLLGHWGSDPGPLHQVMACTMETVLAEIRKIQQDARTKGLTPCPQWPMIVLRTPKGWTGPKEIGGHKVEGSWRAHQIPFNVHENPGHLALLEEWLQSYRPKGLFNEKGKLVPAMLPPWKPWQRPPCCGKTFPISRSDSSIS